MKFQKNCVILPSGSEDWTSDENKNNPLSLDKFFSVDQIITQMFSQNLACKSETVDGDGYLQTD